MTAQERHVALLRRINVSGRNTLLMRELLAPGMSLSWQKVAPGKLVLAESAGYQLAPERIGRSCPATWLERVLGTAVTGRNLRTAQAISALLD